MITNLKKKEKKLINFSIRTSNNNLKALYGKKMTRKREERREEKQKALINKLPQFSCLATSSFVVVLSTWSSSLLFRLIRNNELEANFFFRMYVCLNATVRIVGNTRNRL